MTQLIVSDSSLPAAPNPTYYRKKAKQLLRAYLHCDTVARLRFEARLPDKIKTPAAIKLADAQTVLAREHGCANWSQFLSLIDNTREQNYSAGLREKFSEQLCSNNNITNNAIRDAFTNVPREKYLGPPPWRFLEFYNRPYQFTLNDNLQSVYKDVQVEANRPAPLNNGIPSTQALWLQALNPQAGENVLHIACNNGYYSALLSDIVGENGHVYCCDMTPGQAASPAEKLSHLPQAKAIDPETIDWRKKFYDVVLINAGVAELKPEWLHALKDKGRLLVSVTVYYESCFSGFGETVLITRQNDGFHAKFLPSMNYFSSGFYLDFGPRDFSADQKLKSAYIKKGFRSVRSLRLDKHKADQSCWLHSAKSCLSKKPV
ncbi:MAG: hypothetical protein CMP91_01190 [Gammaproteobacteria bacterium]|nr:hypothetical protein [Gammaproteobacteria bacterium]|tara:strand:+ start:479613 stop:480737 length:1125 start_codon:yes stop_codon:yes gene_type:complete